MLGSLATLGLLIGLSLVRVSSLEEASNAYLQPKLIGGRKVSDGEFPFVVAVTLRGSYIGSGSLIRDNLVLTSARVAALSSLALSLVRILAGTVNIANDIDINRVEAGVISVEVHPLWIESNKTCGDVALIHLKEKLKLNRFVKTITLPRTLGEPQGFQGYVLGWGSTNKSDAYGTTETLQMEKFPIIDNRTCSDLFTRQPGGFERELQFCAGGGGIDACYYDSGAPLITKNTDGGYSVHGLYSRGGQCVSSIPGNLFTRVSSYLDWILEEMEKDPPNPSTTTTTTTTTRKPSDKPSTTMKPGSGSIVGYSSYLIIINLICSKIGGLFL